MFSFTLCGPFREAILLPCTNNQFSCWFFHVSATDFSAFHHLWLSFLSCPDFYISYVDNFSLGMGSGDVLTLNLSALTECVLCSSWGFCFVFVQRDLLKQVLVKEMLFRVSYTVLKSGLLQVEVAELLSLSADIDQCWLNPFFQTRIMCFDCLFLYMILEVIPFHLSLIKWSDVSGLLILPFSK